MISIIICSINDALLKQLRANIIESVGIPFEIIAIDNKKEKKSIAAVYNKGAGLAKFDCLCFVHEDVIIQSKDWGQTLIELFGDESIGLVGVQGAVYKSKYPGTWSACDPHLYRPNFNYHSKKPIHSSLRSFILNKKVGAEVVVIDGVFLATTRRIFFQYQFDDKLLKGFHGYDIDYSLQIGTKYKVIVTYDILLEHFSSGTLNKEWLDSSISVHNKWKKELPKSVMNLGKEITSLSDYISNECVINAGLKSNRKVVFILLIYLRLIFKYFRFNRLKYTKTIIYYLGSLVTNKNINV